VETIRRFSVGAIAAAAMLGMVGCSAMSGSDTVGGAEAGGFIGYQIVKNQQHPAVNQEF
jgi:uncharacterized protein YcfJ